MEVNEAVALMLISEIKKSGRECLYDLSHILYKNNHVKRRMWTEIAEVIGIERSECQALWNSLRRRHKAAINKNLGKSGSERIEVKGFSKILIMEMDYFLNFWEDKDITVTNYTDSNTESFRNLFNEMSCDPDVQCSSIEDSELLTDNSLSLPYSTPKAKAANRQKRSKTLEAEDEYKESIKTLNNLAASVIQASNETRDPFFLALESEFSKVPENRKGALKLNLMSQIIEQQK